MPTELFKQCKEHNGARGDVAVESAGLPCQITKLQVPPESLTFCISLCMCFGALRTGEKTLGDMSHVHLSLQRTFSCQIDAHLTSPHLSRSSNVSVYPKIITNPKHWITYIIFVCFDIRYGQYGIFKQNNVIMLRLWGILHNRNMKLS